MIDILLFGLTLIILFIFVRRKPKNFLPGPPNLPLIGSIPFLEKDLRKTITKLRKKYGPGKCYKIEDESLLSMSTVREYGTIRHTLKYGTVRYSSFVNTYLLDRTFSQIDLQFSFTNLIYVEISFT
jgi:hypothetical protein